MFPEDDLRAEFWFFVRGRALDKRIILDDGGENTPAGTGTLNWIEEWRGVVEWRLSKRRKPAHEIKDAQGFTVAYDSLQDALLAFLIYKVSSKGLGFPYSYATWLRTVVLILADAHQDPNLLNLTVPVGEDGLLDPSASRHQEHTMTLSGEWDCLSQDTFSSIVQAFSPPRGSAEET